MDNPTTSPCPNSSNIEVRKFTIERRGKAIVPSLVASVQYEVGKILSLDEDNSFSSIELLNEEELLANTFTAQEALKEGNDLKFIVLQREDGKIVMKIFLDGSRHDEKIHFTAKRGDIVLGAGFIGVPLAEGVNAWGGS